jgi:hypothetical protein
MGSARHDLDRSSPGSRVVAPSSGGLREEIMEILEGFDLTGSYRDAAELAGCSLNTVTRYVAARVVGDRPKPWEVNYSGRPVMMPTRQARSARCDG